MKWIKGVSSESLQERVDSPNYASMESFDTKVSKTLFMLFAPCLLPRRRMYSSTPLVDSCYVHGECLYRLTRAANSL